MEHLYPITLGLRKWDDYRNTVMGILPSQAPLFPIPCPFQHQVQTLKPLEGNKYLLELIPDSSQLYFPANFYFGSFNKPTVSGDNSFKSHF